jgi:hypothetical protein
MRRTRPSTLVNHDHINNWNTSFACVLMLSPLASAHSSDDVSQTTCQDLAQFPSAVQLVYRFVAVVPLVRLAQSGPGRTLS